MEELSELINFENENSSLDFKAIQYKKDQYESFLKDVMSMVNSLSKEDKYIIIGVKHFPDGNRDFLGIRDNFIDDATYQQLVDSNIEPDIDFEYFLFELKDIKFGIFKFKNCTNPPYMMKKDFGKLKIGDSFIRKGSFQKRLSRKDLDLIFNKRKKNDISNKIEISFSENIILKKTKLDKHSFKLPSEKVKEKIEKIIKKKEEEFANIPSNTLTKLFNITNYTNAFAYTEYEDRDLYTLKNNLKTLETDYEDQNEFYRNETLAHKINFFIHNNSSNFLESTSVEILIPTSEDYFIRKSIIKKVEPFNPYGSIITKVSSPNWNDLNYPNVKIKEKSYKIYEEVGTVKHKLPTKVLKVPLRLVVNNNKNKIYIDIDIKLFAKNIAKPIKEKLRICI